MAVSQDNRCFGKCYKELNAVYSKNTLLFRMTREDDIVFLKVFMNVWDGLRTGESPQGGRKGRMRGWI